MVSASVALADSLGLSVVAEGVETYDQYRALAKLGCQLAQGYALSPPVPLERAHELWTAGYLIDLTALD
ncbi:MAG: EAL domain-containing protein [Acidimicrobiales bacterium]